MTVYILSGARTPQGSFLGGLSSVTAVKLGGCAIKGALERASLAPDQIEEVFMGHVIQAGTGQAPARQAALAASLSPSVPCTTVNKVCGSGLIAIILAARTLLAPQENQLVVAGGMENMSLAPHLLLEGRKGHKFGPYALEDSMERDGLLDAYSDRTMGSCAEECAREYQFTREEQDSFAIESFRRAQQAVKEGIFKKEIVPVETGDKLKTRVDVDEGPWKAKFDKIPKLSPVFEKGGTITPANASTINDGATALILAGPLYKAQAKFKIVAWAGHAHAPVKFTTAPIFAMKKCLEKSGLSSFKDIGVFEINEAFSVVVMAVLRELELPHSKVNIYGGAISLGHPLGASGARIVVTLMTAMENQKSQYGMASLCLGGGEALALLIEKMPSV